MEHIRPFDPSIIDPLIHGRVEPYIYAFTTEEVPNYLKVGDTYRGVNTRLEEWREVFPNLKKQYEGSAQINKNKFFRDFAVHKFLMLDRGRKRLDRNAFKNLKHYSKEFFESATVNDVKDAIADILKSEKNNNGKYQFYTPDHLPAKDTFTRDKDYEPRRNQQEAIDNFKTAVAEGRNNLLMYAVMRFGKTFTALCCAKAIDARLVVIVTAKPQVASEWQEAVQSHKDFENYDFLKAKDLIGNNEKLAETFKSGKKVVLFLSLQDLQGDNIKDKHKELFEQFIDLLIIDETHFGARANSLGKVLSTLNLKKNQVNKELKKFDKDEDIYLEEVEESIKHLNAKIRLHLSGTPYRILMGGEFQKKDIICSVQFTDIVEAQKEWDKEHLLDQKDNTEKDSTEYEEWDNPYYGFPQMIRFAFNPNESSRKKMEEMRKQGITFTLSELFRPQSISAKENGDHRLFIHEANILDLLQAIDGSKYDENIFDFLDYDKIKEGKMCRHMVWVLPFRASCDAVAKLLKDNKDSFKNLGEYDIINIAGFDDETRYKTVDDIKRVIEDSESKGHKTITLTVNRMLTGSTVKEWDTMLFFKDTASPQEYDQATFRIQSPYIQDYTDSERKIIKYIMKPQTLLVDFDPNRMFRLQELKSFYSTVNSDGKGNDLIKERIEKELSISPIIVVNKNKLEQVTPTNITDAVREYSQNQNILDEASDIPTDFNLLANDDILSVIKSIAPYDKKKGLQIKPNEGEGQNIETPGEDPNGSNSNGNDSLKVSTSSEITPKDEEDDNIEQRLAAYYARILYFAYLTDSTVKSLAEIIIVISADDDNKRIARNLGLDTAFLSLIHDKLNPNILKSLDYRIENINDLMSDCSLSPIERAEVTTRKFNRMSESEIVTPAKLAEEMVGNLPDERIPDDAKFLDIASKQGEFAIAIYKRFGEKAKNYIYSIPTSGLAYEFTLKTYKLLGLPVENIFTDFNSYDLIDKTKNKEIIQRLKDMNFKTIIGNPPYQVSQANDGDANNRAMAGAIYPLFIDVATNLRSHFVCMITPSRWMTKTGRGISNNWVDKMLNGNHFISIFDFTSASDCFNNVEIKGGVNHFLYSSEYNGPCTFVSVRGEERVKSVNFLNDSNVGFVVRDIVAQKIISKVQNKSTESFMSLVGPNTLFCDCAKGILNTNWDRYSVNQSPEHTIKYYLNKKAVACGYAWIKPSDMIKGYEVVPLHKVYIPEASGTGNDDQILALPFYGEPGSICSQTYICIGYDVEKQLSKAECHAVIRYIRTKFLRYLVSIKKNTQHGFAQVYQLVPMQDFTEGSDINWSKSVEEIDKQLYKKYELSSDEIAFIESMIKPM